MEMKTNRPFKILIVDDDEMIRSGLAQLLGMYGYEVDVAKNGVEGSQTFNFSSAYDLVITDILMPLQNGLAFILELLDMNPEIPIIAISGGGEVSGKSCLEAARKLGATMTLEKPISSTELVEAVQQVLAERVRSNNGFEFEKNKRDRLAK